MTIEEKRFLDEMLRTLRAEMSDVRRDLLGLGLRMTAMEQQMAGVHTMFVGFQHALDGVASDLNRVKARLELGGQ